MFTSAIIITTTLALSIGLSGCGKQEVQPVMAATVEQQTLTYEITTEEESVIATEEETESIQESSTDETETESVTVQDFTITEINLELQATQNAMTYEKPDGNTEVSGVRKDEIVAVIGKVDNTNWYQIDQEGFKSFIDSKYLKEIEQQQPAQNENTNQDDNKNNGNNNNQQQQPKAETPKENPQPPVVDPPAPSGDGDTVYLPDGSYIKDDGTVIHIGEVDPDTHTADIGSMDGWW